MLDEIIISKAIIESYQKEFVENLESDVIICGGGPSGLCAGYYLSRAGFRVVLLERTLRPGGGLPGGAMMYNKIVIQEESKPLMDEWGIDTQLYQDNYYVASALETLGVLLAQSIKSGTHIFNCLSAEDVMIYDNRVHGVVINWSSAEIAGMHVDPLTMRSRFVIDATGHAAEIAHVVARKSGAKLLTSTGGVIGEKPMWADKGERILMKNTKEIFSHLYVCGMAANAVFGGQRMGPIFGGMLLSGKKVAQDLIKRLQEEKN